MTIKKLWKRICSLFHVDRTRLRNGESVEDWEEVQQKRREIEAERQKKEDEILSTWFVRDEYINAGWFKRILLTLQFLLRDTDILRIPMTADASYPIPIPRISLYESSKNFSRIQISKR